ncbi:MAG: GNAT family N-acetyltransferase [Candidatus Xenobia bacterium]
MINREPLDLGEGTLARPYEPRDRAAVRRICCDTADRGRPVEGFFRDRELFADLMTSYYTDWAPEALWVLEQDGRVVGYLTGCLNRRKQRRIMGWLIVPRTLLKALIRPSSWRDVWSLLFNNFRLWLTQRLAGEEGLLSRFPAELHINLEPGVRGRHLGARLVEMFLRQAAAVGIPGVTASVREDNKPARSFFERMGFVPVTRLPLMWSRRRPGKRIFSVIYGKTLAAS